MVAQIASGLKPRQIIYAFVRDRALRAEKLYLYRVLSGNRRHFVVRNSFVFSSRNWLATCNYTRGIGF